MILQILTVAYYLSTGRLDAFEFHLTLFLLAVTGAATAIVLRKIVKEVCG